MQKRPNFILYITDQHRADYLGCYGHPVLKTPNIDKLAESGCAFDRFYVSSPVCMPNRASLMTCRMPTSHGVRMNGIPLERRHVTFVELLRDVGYKTALIGKSHLQPMAARPGAWAKPEPREGYYKSAGDLDEAVRHDLNDPWYYQEDRIKWANEGGGVPLPFYGFDHVELAGGHGDNIGCDYSDWLHRVLPNAADYIGAENQLAHDYECPQAVRTALPEQYYSTNWIADRAAAFIDEQKSSNQPFFLMVSWPDPHHPFNPPGKYWDMYDPNDMPVPEAFKRNDWTPPPQVAGVIKNREIGKANLKGMNTIGCSARESQEAQALTCGMIAMIDDAVGRVEDAINSGDRADHTVRVFTTDHGDHLGDHKLLFKGSEQYEQITRVPFIWTDPEKPHSCRIGDIGQTHDIGTTILERAQIEPATGMQGTDLFGDTPRDAAHIQYAHQVPLPILGVRPQVHTLRDHRYRLSLFGGMDWGELYDLNADPGELENLWDSQDMRDVKLGMIERLLRAELENVSISPMPTRWA